MTFKDHLKKILTGTKPAGISSFNPAKPSGFPYFKAALAATLFILSAFTGSHSAAGIARVDSVIHNNPALCDSLLAFAEKYLNKPYCYGSRVPSCFDCSGFVNHVFATFGTKVPNSSGAIALEGRFISFKNAVKGDLVFFNGRNANSETVGHVGIVSAFSGDTIHFIHASVQAGVIYSHTLEPYYSKRLLFVKRVKLNSN